jgi:protein-tyrosine phosphatase
MDISSLDGEPDRRIRLPGTVNLRDLGGYRTADGGTTRWRTLLRSDSLHRLDDSGRAALTDLGLRTVIDLRTDQEVQATPSALDGTGARTYHVPLFDASAVGNLEPELAAVYRYMIDNCGPAIATAVNRLCASSALPGLVHCTAGKDRTGLVSALVLEAVGVPDDVIAADYAMSDAYLDPSAAKTISSIRAISGVGRWLDLGAMGAQPQIIRDALDRIRTRDGSVTAYLERNGLARADLISLRRALVAPSA